MVYILKIVIKNSLLKIRTKAMREASKDEVKRIKEYQKQ